MSLGIIEKSNNGLFENEIEFNGEYATMVRYLKETAGIFVTFREAYLVSTVVGFVLNLRCTEEKPDKVQPASIFASDLNKKKQELRLLYRYIMLCLDNDKFTIDDYTNRAFRDDPEDLNSTVKDNMNIFHSFTCGGLIYLYDKFKDLNIKDQIVNTLYDFVHGLISEFGFNGDSELPDFTPEFD